MKFWNKRIIFGLFTGALLVGGLSACAHQHGGPGWHHSAEDSAKFRARMIERISSQLDLNADQKQKLGVLADKLQEQRMALRGKSTDPRADMQALIAGDKLDRSRAQALVSEKTGAVQAKSPEVISALGDFYDSLNVTQQQKVREFMQRGGHRWGGRG